VEALAASELEEGRPERVPPLLQPLIEQDPVREEPRRLLMLALYRTGRQADALSVYRDFRGLLSEELGLDPSPELTQLEEQILLQDPLLRPTSTAGRSGPVVARNPYKGLRPFDEVDAEDFFGRDKLVAEMTDALAGGDRLLVVVGPSGSGKSSVVRAGFVPALRSGRVPGLERWVLATMVPGRHPFEQLEATLVRAARAEIMAVLEQLTEDDTGLLRIALRMLPDDRSELLLVVDQFEEIFTLATEEVRRLFLSNLVTATSDPRSRVRVVLTLRADFYDRPLLSSQFAPVFASSVVNVVPMTPAELEQAIVEPAHQLGVALEPTLLAQLVADMRDEAVALPLLQYSLTEMFEARDGASLTLDLYLKLGSMHGAVSARADRIFDELPAESRDVAKRLFLRLVRVEKGGEPTRRRVPLDELRGAGGSDDALDEVLAQYISNRLLAVEKDAFSGTATVQVTHEALLSAWGLLARWIDEHRIDLERHGAVIAAAAEWEAAGRHDDYLLSGARLTEVIDWAGATQLDVGPTQRAFIDASAQRQRRREKQEAQRATREALFRTRARRRLWGMAAALLLAAFVATYVVLDTFGDRPPKVVLFAESGNLGFLGMISSGYERAQDAVTVPTARVVYDTFTIDDELRRVIESGTEYVILASSEEDANLLAAASEHPDVRFGIIGGGVYGPPNVAALNFAEEEGSFLVGVAAALSSETGRIGFIGGVDIMLIHKFEAGFVAGAKAVRPDITVDVEYLTPFYDWSGFMSPTLGAQAAERLYRSDSDVVYVAAGESGLGAFEVAARLSPELGRHLWVIGVDSDEYYTSQDFAVPGEVDPGPWQAHILTSMLKRMDVAVDLMIQEFAQDAFTKERVLGLADDGVGYSTSGGHVDHLVPTLEEFKARITVGEITVPTVPEICEPDPETCENRRAEGLTGSRSAPDARG
jgi:basic membrane lipoprotein Med (substrate-binding protein (PBP1-ABC) superfamily)